MPVSLLVYDSSLRIIPTEVIKFPGGEPHVKITGQRELFYAKRAIVDCRFKSNDDLMATIALTDAARRIGIKDIGLFIPYFPGARQDRVKNFSGEALTCKIYADIINSQGYEAVWVVDPHSDVTPALLNNAKVITQKEILESRLGRYDGIISPDAGSRKKCEDIAEACGLKIYYGAKHRDMATGKLSHFSCEELPLRDIVYKRDVLDKQVSPPHDGYTLDEGGRSWSRKTEYIVLDDICDGGGTFIGLKEAIENQESAIDLFVTHGIFSKGTEELSKNYRKIITTDSVIDDSSLIPGYKSNLEIINLHNVLRGRL